MDSLLANRLTRDQPRLSVCMVVRDSARTLGDCLASIRPYVDEIIVVDTGSLDATPQIAQSFGAQVSQFPWCDDFGAARNESLRLASGEWLFWMDSDDTIPVECGRRLRALADGEHAERTLGYVMQVHCPGPEGADSPELTVVDHVKLIRNHPELRFEGRIHEQIIQSIRRLGGNVEWTDLHVIHSGSEHFPEAKQRKVERDLRILQLDLAERPNHPFVLFNLGMTFNDMGSHREAVLWLERCLKASSLHESHVRKAFALLVGSLLELSELQEALRICGEGLQHYSQDAELLFRQGIVLHKLGQLEQAAAAYRRVLIEREDRHFSSVDPGICGYKARHNLALVYMDLGRHDLSELQWRLIIETLPDYRPAWSSLGATLLQQKKFSALDAVIDSMSVSPLLGVEKRLLTAELAMARQDFAGVRAVLDGFSHEAAQDMRVQRLHCHYLFECGTLDEAEAAIRLLLSREPDCPMSLHNLGVVLLRQQKLFEAAEALRRSLALRPSAHHTRGQLEIVEKALNASHISQGDISNRLAGSSELLAGIAPAVTALPLTNANGAGAFSSAGIIFGMSGVAVPSDLMAAIARQGATGATLTPSYEVGASSADRRFEWISLGKLATATRELASLLPGNIAGIVGIPRSGMIPASILAALLQAPLYELANDASLRPLNHGARGHILGWAGDCDGPLVIVDDTVYGGGSMAWVRQATATLRKRLIYAAVFVRPEVSGIVDLYARLLPSPHLLEWNFFNSGVLVGVSIDPVLWGGAALDFDGILCRDSPVIDADEGPDLDAYVKWLRCAVPRWLPRRLPVKCIITARLERWRAETEDWLRRHGVYWDCLIMHPADRISVRNGSDIAAWKAQALLDSGCRWYVESDHRQARRIQQLAGCPVICPDAEMVFH